MGDVLPLDLARRDKMGEALSRVSQVKRVPVELARKYGLYGEGEDDIAALEHGDEGSVDIPCWRHAIINFPHPLLQQGLVILDTPGLNAIGTEPELTLNLLPNAHAVLFILAADAGVTKTDLEVWNQHLAGDDPAQGRPHRHPEQDRRPVGRPERGSRDRPRDRAPGRVRRATAGHPAAQVFAASAQKALVGKVNGDDALLREAACRRSRRAVAGAHPAKRRTSSATRCAGSSKRLPASR